MSTHVIFGTGAVGIALAKNLLTKGQSVRMISRSGGRDIPDGVDLITGDANDREFAKKAVANGRVVYFAAMPPYTKWAELFPTLQDSVLKAAGTNGAKFIAVENLYAYGDVQGATLTEDLPSLATGKKGRTRAQMTRSLLQAHREGKVQVAIARASDFFGPHALVSQMGERVFYPAVAGGKAQFLNGIDQPHAYTYIGDFAATLAILGEREEALGEIWHVPNAQTVTTREFVDMVYEEAGTGPAKFSIMPGLMTNILSLFNKDVKELKEVRFEYEHPHVVDDTKMRSAFGLEPTPLKDAIEETVDWYKANPK